MKPRRSRKSVLENREGLMVQAADPALKRAYSARKSRSSEQSLLILGAATTLSAKASKCSPRYSKFRTMKKTMTPRKRPILHLARVLMRHLQKQRVPRALGKLAGWSRSWASHSLETLPRVTANPRRRSLRNTIICTIVSGKRGMSCSSCCTNENS